VGRIVKTGTRHPISALTASVRVRKCPFPGRMGLGGPGLGRGQSAPCSRLLPVRASGGGGPRGAQRPRSGAAGALGAARREPDNGRPGSGSPWWREMGSVVRVVAFLCGVTGRGGRVRGQEQPALPRSAGLGAAPAT
jgi:hypothetical protein